MRLFFSEKNFLSMKFQSTFSEIAVDTTSHTNMNNMNKSKMSLEAIRPVMSLTVSNADIVSSL